MNIQLTPDPDIRVKKIRIGRVPVLVLSPKGPRVPGPGVLWIHGGGYILGMKEMVHMSRAVSLVKKFGAVVLAPDYRLAPLHPYPAGLRDCYRVLRYMKENAAQLGYRPDLLMVGGESAGGGLTAALCLLARDRGDVKIAFQMPLYPMLDDRDTETSRDNHGRVWNTRRNHLGWKMYLRGTEEKGTPRYAAPARACDLSGLPPAYSFVGTGEPFYAETKEYIRRLREAGIPARMDEYPTDMHAFDMLEPEKDPAPEAIRRFEEAFARALKTCRAPQEEKE